MTTAEPEPTPAPFDPAAALPPLNIRPATRLWEPAHQHYRDLPKEREQA